MSFLAVTGPLLAPQPGQVLLGYQVCEPTVRHHDATLRHCLSMIHVQPTSSKSICSTSAELRFCMLQTGCCQCDNLSPAGWVSVILLLLFFWPLFWIPFVMPECYEVGLTMCSACPRNCRCKRHLLSDMKFSTCNTYRSQLLVCWCKASALQKFQMTKRASQM